MAVRELRSISEIPAVREQWHQLLAATAGANFFQTPEWLEVYWKHFGKDQDLRLLTLSENNRLTGIVPLIVRTESTRAGKIRFLTYPLDYWGSFYGPIGKDQQRLLRQSLQYLQANGSAFDAVELRWVGGENGLDQTNAVFRAVGWQPSFTRHDQTSLIDVSGSWDGYLASRTSKWRNNYRRWQRNLNKLGTVRYQRYRSDETGDPQWELYERCLEVARVSWQGDSEDGTTLSHPSVSNFLRDVHQAAAAIGAVDVNLLYIDDRPVAFAYGYHYRGAVYGLRVGMLSNVSRTGAGNLLYAHVIEDSFARGDWQYDLGCGSLAAKRHLQTSVESIYRIGHFPMFPLRCQLLKLKRLWDQRKDATHAEAESVAV